MNKYYIYGIAVLILLGLSFLLGRCSVTNVGNSVKTTVTSNTTTKEIKTPIPTLPTLDSGKAKIIYRNVPYEVPVYIDKEIDTNIWTKKQLADNIDLIKQRADECCKPYTASRELITKSKDTVGFWYKHPEGTYNIWEKPVQRYEITKETNTNTTVTVEKTFWQKFNISVGIGYGINTDTKLTFQAGIYAGYTIW